MAMTTKKSGRRPARARAPAAKMTTRKSISGVKSRKGSTRLSTRAPVRKPARASSKRAPAAKSFEVGGMTVREAGRKGGLIGGKKGGETVKRERGVEFYQQIGRKGGQRVRDLIAAGRKAFEKPAKRRHT